MLTLNLTAPFGTAGKPVSLQFTGYIVDGSHIQLIETDAAAGAASPFGLTAGLAIGQGTATGTFTGNASFTGTYVFGIPGVDLSNSNLAPSTLTSAGLFSRWCLAIYQWIHGHLPGFEWNFRNGRSDQRSFYWNLFRRFQRNGPRQPDFHHLHSRAKARV